MLLPHWTNLQACNWGGAIYKNLYLLNPLTTFTPEQTEFIKQITISKLNLKDSYFTIWKDDLSTFSLTGKELWKLLRSIDNLDFEILIYNREGDIHQIRIANYCQVGEWGSEENMDFSILFTSGKVYTGKKEIRRYRRLKKLNRLKNLST